MASTRPHSPSWVAAYLPWLMMAGCEASTTVDLLPDADQADQTEDSGADSALDTLASAACPVESADAADTSSSVSGLIHRYDFSGTGTSLCDRVGDRHGSILGGAALDGSGTLGLDGSDDYVALPPGMISGSSAVTLVAWFTWRWNRAWERVFDFGDTEVVDAAVQSKSHFFYTPLYLPGPGTSANYAVDGKTFFPSNGTLTFPTEAEQQIAVVFPGGDGLIRTYLNGNLDGVPEKSEPPPPLSQLLDRNGWLGQSQQSWDPHTAGVYDEFRIYQRALTEAEILALFDAGPDRP